MFCFKQKLRSLFSDFSNTKRNSPGQENFLSRAEKNFLITEKKEDEGIAAWLLG
jgi:hypothetical protein